MAGKMRVYVEADVAGFRFTRAPFGIFSNMHDGCPLHLPLADRAWKVDSSETIYQMLKFSDAPHLQRGIFNAGTELGPKAGKRAAWSGGTPVPDRWERDRIAAMRWVLRLKLAQHRKAVLDEIKAADGRDIVEISKRDDFWGAIPDGNGKLVGANVLGRLWMELRAEIAADPEIYTDRVAAPGTGFRIFGSELVQWRRSTVLNAHVVGKDVPEAVYIGRPSIFGNPFPVQESGGRDACLGAYVEHLKENPEIVDKARRELQNRDLICWCAPQACHGDILLRIAAGDPVPDRFLPASEPETVQQDLGL